MQRKPKVGFRFLFFVILLGGCASYQQKVFQARNALRQGNALGAVTQLKPLAETPSDDQLIYLLDYAIALQESKDFRASARVLDVADKKSAVENYHSLSRISGSMLLSEEMVQYKGEDYEKVLINAQAAISYLMAGDLESALVECRRLNEKLYRYKKEGGKNYEQNAFARYLAGVIWEADKKWSDAYLDYVAAHEISPGVAYLKEDILRTAYLSGRQEDYLKWKAKFPDVQVSPNAWRSKSVGEVILIYQQGWAPHKRPRPEAPRYPMLVHSPSTTRRAQLEVAGGKYKALSSPVFSVEDVAIKTMNDDYAALVARRVGGVLVKATVAEQLRQKDENLGQLAWILMNVADRADLRQWSTLPESFQIARLTLPAGDYSVYVRGLSSALYPTGEMMNESKIKIRPGKKVFLMWRSFN
jgi:hypothetical protein